MLQDVAEHLSGEDGLLLVAGISQSDDHAIADDRVFPNPLDAGNVADRGFAHRVFAVSGRARHQKDQKRYPTMSHEKTLLKANQPQQPANKCIRGTDAIAEHAFAFQFEFEICHLIRLHRVVGSHVARTD
jgi:hypothetical protein